MTFSLSTANTWTPNCSPNWHPVSRTCPLQSTSTQQQTISLHAQALSDLTSGCPSDLNFLLLSCWHSCWPFTPQGLCTCCCSSAWNSLPLVSLKHTSSLYSGLCSNIKILEASPTVISVMVSFCPTSLSSYTELLFFIAFAAVLLCISVTHFFQLEYIVFEVKDFTEINNIFPVPRTLFGTY